MMDDKQVSSEPYRKWSIGGLAILAPQEAVLVLFQGDPEGGVVIRTTDGFEHWSAAFTDDNRVFHGVTPIEPLDPARPGHRDVLVVTFRRE